MDSPVFESRIDEELKRQQAEKYPLALPLGTILNGRFLVQRVLGQGGFGITYLAWDLVDHGAAAVKEYLPQNLANRITGNAQMTLYQGDLREQYDKGMGDFLKEAKVLATFNGDPHIVGARRFFEENGTAYLVMEYVRGQSFKQYIKDRGGRIPWQDALRVMVPVMDALQRVHEQGILHRDVAPDNIYLTPEGGVKLLDFGAARSAMGNRNQSMTVMLKPGYTPLEQYTRNGKQGPYSDVYSVAATLYGAITGYLPPDAVDRIEEDHLVPISTLGIDIPGQLEAAILKGLSVSASRRFQTMGEFENEVQYLLPGKEPKTEESWLCSCGTLNTGRFCSECGAPRPGSGPDPQELDRKRQEELDRQRQEELDRKHQEELDRQRREELDRQRREELDRQRQEILEQQKQWERDQAAKRRLEDQKVVSKVTPRRSGKKKKLAVAAAVLAAAVIGGAFLLTPRDTETGKSPILAGKKTPSELSELVRAAEEGDTESQYELGRRFLQGDHNLQDDNQAFIWLMKAAEKGHAEAQNLVGYCYITQRGTGPVNGDPYVKAFPWFVKAAKQASPGGQYNLAVCYLYGYGTDQDADTGFRWINEAAMQDYPEAFGLRGDCYLFGFGADTDEEQAVADYRQGAVLEDAYSMFRLGACYLAGTQVERDMDRAYRWIRSSAEAGESNGQAALGDCYSYGWGVEEDQEEAFRWYRMSAAQGNQSGCFSLAGCYFYGLGVYQNVTESLKWYERAGELGSGYAYYLMGNIYRHGEQEISPDLQLAKSYYEKAAEMGMEEAQKELDQLQ